MIMHEKNLQELEHPSSYLTDNYKKDVDSNNYKILDLGHQEHKDIMDNLRLIETWRNIDKAEGFTLDKIGKNVLELRNNRGDQEYRKAIKIKIRGNLSAGTVEDLNVLAEILFGENFISISDTWHRKDYNFEPAAMVLHLHNFFEEKGANFWGDIRLLNEAMAGGVGLYNRQTFDIDTNTYHISTISIYKSWFVISDVQEIPKETADYSIGATQMFIREEYIE